MSALKPASLAGLGLGCCLADAQTHAPPGRQAALEAEALKQNTCLSEHTEARLHILRQHFNCTQDGCPGN